MKTIKKALAFLLMLMLAASLAACGQKTAKPKIRNVILLISDGTSVGVSTLSRWRLAYDEAKGTFDTNTRLCMDDYVSGLIRTYWQQSDGSPGAITDSAPSATAYSTGYKSQNQFVGMGVDGKPRATVLELAKSLGKSTGLVVTVNLQNATPAAFAAHTTDRSDYETIAAQMLTSGADVLLGGGARYMQNRADGRDLIAELQKMGYGYVTNADQLAAFKGTKVYGLFASGSMEYEIDRPMIAPQQPSLPAMTDKAISLLSQNDKGFFLMVEGSKVDWGAHNHDTAGIVSEFLAFDKAVKSAMDFAKGRTDTMVLVVEDHGTGGISIGSSLTDANYSSYPLKNIIQPLTDAKITVQGAIELLAEGRDAKEVLGLMGINDPTAEELTTAKTIKLDVDELNADDQSRVLLGQMLSRRCDIGWTTTGHTGEDVVLYSYLPGNERLTGLYDNTEINKAICDAWGAKLTDAVCPHMAKK